jgi:hypothetical protein
MVSRWTKLAYRLAIPALALVVFTVFAALWAGGWEAAYIGLLRAVGVHPFTFPFVDAHAVLSAAECQRQGIDVYSVNPCDVLGRPHAYSPLWLSIVPNWLGTTELSAIGLAVDLAFIASLGIVFRPQSPREMVLYALAAFSPVVMFAVERCNNDLIVFIAVVAAAKLWNRAPRARLAAYGVCLAAALLKYYPIVLLAFVARERLRRAAVIALAAGLTLLLFGWNYREQIGPALANIPKLSPFADAFSALNLPYGISALIEGGAGWHRNFLAMSLMAGLTTVCLLLIRSNIARLGGLPIDFTGWEMRCLGFAAALLPACFFAAQNMAYRGVYLLLLVPGLLQLREGVALNPAVRRWLGLMLAAGYFVLWEACPLNVADVFTHVNESVATALWLALWFIRELVWWWLISGLLAIAVLAVESLPLTAQIISLKHRLWSRLGQTEQPMH